MKVTDEEWKLAFMDFKKNNREGNYFGFTDEQNIEINELISIRGYLDTPEIPFEKWEIVYKTNVFFSSGFYYYQRSFGDQYWNNKFTSYKDLYDYIYSHEFPFVFSRNDIPKIRKDLYIDIIKNSKLDFSIDGYWLTWTFLFINHKNNVGSELMDELIGRISHKNFIEVLKKLDTKNLTERYLPVKQFIKSIKNQFL
jgi:hypothetical protein